MENSDVKSLHPERRSEGHRDQTCHPGWLRTLAGPTRDSEWQHRPRAAGLLVYIGNHKSDLMGQNNQTLGQINPELVRGYAHGLTKNADPNIAEPPK